MEFSESYDIVVVGAGHAGCEAALCCARMGLSTLLTTLNLDSLAMMPCNPAIGGTAKGHLVRELDALGGEMGRAIDDVFIQMPHAQHRQGPRGAFAARAGGQEGISDAHAPRGGRLRAPGCCGRRRYGRCS